MRAKSAGHDAQKHCQNLNNKIKLTSMNHKTQAKPKHKQHCTDVQL